MLDAVSTPPSFTIVLTDSIAAADPSTTSTSGITASLNGIDTEHPADGSWVNRMLRWFLARPVLLTALAVVGVAAVFAALLVIGPPGGREA